MVSGSPRPIYKTAAHPFYRGVNALLDEQKFDEFVEGACRSFYAETIGRPTLTPGMYFRLLLVGYFEGIDAERGIAWRAVDSLAIRQFLHLALYEAAPDHSTISRTRRLIDLETHRAVFTWIQQRLTEARLLKAKTVATDATTLEANAAMRSIVRRDTGEDYQAFLTRLAKESGIETPTREDLVRLDRKRKKKTSNQEWTNPHDPDAKVTKMKDGRTHLAQKAEHAVDVETGAIIAVTVQGADQGDTTTIVETATAAAGRSKTRKPTSRSRRRWKRSWQTRGITAITRWSLSTPWRSGPTLRSLIGPDGTGRRRPTRRRGCTGIVAGFAAVVDGG